jgi:hypothetical protein
MPQKLDDNEVSAAMNASEGSAAYLAARVGLLVRRILERHRDELKRARLPVSLTGKDWSRGELCDVYGSCKALLEGKLKNPPPRQKVLEIAVYLECSLAEANDLLVAAGYHEERPYLEGEALDAALNFAQSVIDYLPMPAFVTTRKWEIPGWNRHLMNLWDFSDEDIARVPEKHRHALHLIFNPKYPFYERMGGFQETDNWRITALQNIFLFKSSNLLSQYDDWYQELYSELSPLKHFPELWAQVDTDSSLQRDPRGDVVFPLYRTKILRTDGTTVWVAGLQASVGNLDFPRIICYVPDSVESQATFTKLGLPTPENHWGVL